MNIISGTNVPLKVYTPTGYRPPVGNASEKKQRRGLLAMVHIAKKDLGLNEGEYEMILRGFKVASSGELMIPQLERLVTYLKSLGWKPVRSRHGNRLEHSDLQLDALRHRCVEIAKSIENGEKRMSGLAEKICGVATIAWCRNPARLERLLAVMGKIREEEAES